MNKYNAKKTEYKGIIYDSKWEANRAYELEMLQRAGQIKDLQLQVRFILQEDYINNKGQKIRPISYIADFVYNQGDETIVEDAKGIKTDAYKIKKKLMLYFFNIRIKEV